MKNIFLILLISISPTVTLAEASPTKCECQPVASVLDSKNSATHVFVGEVLDVILGTNFNVESEKEFLVKTRIKRFWKGNFQEEITIRTPQKKEACGLQFAIGQQYLIYGIGEASPLTTSCSRTVQIDNENAKNDLKHLGEAQFIALPDMKVPDFMQ